MTEDPQLEAAILLDAGSKTIAKLIEEKDAIEKEKAVMAALLDAKNEQIKEITRARDIACFNIADLTNQRSLLMQLVNDAMILIDYLVSDLGHAGLMPSVACGIAKQQWDQKVRKLLSLDARREPTRD